LAASVSSQQDAERKSKITRAALRPLRALQGSVALSPGGISLPRILSDPDQQLIIEHDPLGGWGIQRTTALWLGMIQMISAAQPDLPPLMIATPDPHAVGRLPYQTSAAMLVRP
jgi:hypothetical protein